MFASFCCDLQRAKQITRFSKTKCLASFLQFLSITMFEGMRQAIAAVYSGASVLSSARLHSVPVSTLRSRLKNPCPNAHGGQTIFTRFEEESFVCLCKGFETRKLPLTRTDFLVMVKHRYRYCFGKKGREEKRSIEAASHNAKNRNRSTTK